MKDLRSSEHMVEINRDSLVQLKRRKARLGERLVGYLRALYSIHPQLLAYIVPMLLASLAVQTWFKPGTVIANGDIGPPIAQGTSYLSHWNQVTDGVGAPSYDIVMLPYSEFFRAARALGLDSSMSQRIWLTILIAGSSAAVVFFARSLAWSPLAAGLAGVFATFNIFRVVVSFDQVPASTLILCGLLGGLVARAGLRRNPRSGLLAFALISSVSGFVFVNPPHFILLGAWIVISTLLVWSRGGRESFLSALSFLLRVSPLVVLANSWWIVPAALTILNSGFAERFAAPGPFAWAWTDRRASLVNALTLNTTWGWNEPMYYPYAARLDRLPVALFRYALPLLALLGFVFARRRERRLALALVIVGLVTVVIVKGLHPPFVAVNRWFYIHVPGSWLFREPSKLLLFLMLIYALLAGSAVANLAAMTGRFRVPAAGAMTALSVAAIAFAYPLFTGDVIPDKRPLLPPAHVTVPPAWDEAAKFLNSLADEGKMLVLPNADFYGLPTTWGYYGVPFTRWAIQRPVLEPLPGSGFNLPGIAEQLATSIQGRLLAGRGEEALPAFHALGVRYVLLRRDLDTAFPGRRIANPDRIARGLSEIPGMNLIRSFGLLDLYALDANDASEVYSAVPAASGGEPSLIPRVMTLLPPDASLITPDRLPQTGGLENGVWSPGGEIQILRIGDEALWKVEAAQTSGGLSVRFSDPITTTIGQQKIKALSDRGFHFPRISTPALITLNGSTFVLERGERRREYATLPEDVEIGLWDLRNVVPIDINSRGPVGDCNDYDGRNPAKVGLSASTLQLDGISTLRLSARDHAACVGFPIKPFSREARYRVLFDYLGVSGSSPRVCLWQEVAERCAPLPALDESPGWHHFDATATISSKSGALRLFFYADGTGDSITTTEYRQPRIEVFEQGSTRRLELNPSSRVEVANLPSGWLRLISKSPLTEPKPIDLSSHAPVGDCNAYDHRSPQEVGLTASTVRLDDTSTLRLSARDHAACVAFPIEPFEPAARYRLRFEYRGVTGLPPRVCLWQSAVKSCAVLPELDPSPGWHQFDAPVTLSAKTQAIQLFFYAFGTGDSVTTTEYRDVEVTVDAAENFFLTKGARTANLPVVEYEKQGPARFKVSVSGAANPYLLVLTESYADGWKVLIDGQQANTQHLMVDGYANGWLIDRRGSYEVRLFYQPERFSRLASWISLLFLTGCALYGLGRRLARRKKRRGTRAATRTARILPLQG
jgi:arabinofuranan 3-O-arabinosyltransferase